MYLLHLNSWNSEQLNKFKCHKALIRDYYIFSNIIITYFLILLLHIFIIANTRNDNEVIVPNDFLFQWFLKHKEETRRVSFSLDPFLFSFPSRMWQPLTLISRVECCKLFGASYGRLRVKKVTIEMQSRSRGIIYPVYISIIIFRTIQFWISLNRVHGNSENPKEKWRKKCNINISEENSWYV